MRVAPNGLIEPFRIHFGPPMIGTNNGYFAIPKEAIQKQLGVHNRAALKIVASDGTLNGWEHVSVSLYAKQRCPDWEEMCLVKTLFWEDSEAVLQIHPPENEYINEHAYTLHLWKSLLTQFILPHSDLVGARDEDRDSPEYQQAEQGILAAREVYETGMAALAKANRRLAADQAAEKSRQASPPLGTFSMANKRQEAAVMGAVAKERDRTNVL